MGFTYIPGSDRGNVRLLIQDTDVNVFENQVFQDNEIDAFLALEGNDVRFAAARALDTIATNQTLVLKVVRLLDLSTDGAAVGRELRQQAEALRHNTYREVVV